jgi:23S rRNA (uracil1939-C5)-methyltransferase
VQLRAGPIVFGGACLSHLEDGRVVFISFAAPGELVEAAIERSHNDYLEAVVVRIIEPSPHRTEPPCELFGQCGGCQLQHITYAEQLRAKEEVVREQLRRIGRLDEAAVRPIVGAEHPWAYRNHLRFSTGRMYGDLGFIRRGGRALMKVESCPIADPWLNERLGELQGHGRGLHQVQMRRSPATGDYLVYPEMPGAPFPTGQDSYRESLAGHEFQVQASAFFQVNAAQAEQMVRLVGSALPRQGRLLVDAFAGVGTFAVIFAGRFERVIAIEESRQASADAEVNIRVTPNVEMRAGKVEEILPFLDAAPDAVLLDPPRPGCAPAVLEAIARFRPARVVYVSCNPSTLARDLRLLVDSGYTLDHVTPLDMFPQTGHIECVSQLTLADAGESGS